MTAVCGAGSSGMSHLSSHLKEKEDRLCDEGRSRDNSDLTAGHGGSSRGAAARSPAAGRPASGWRPSRPLIAQGKGCMFIIHTKAPSVQRLQLLKQI